MPLTIYQLKEELLRALDDNSNVISSDAAMLVIRKLETFPITKDMLEETRLGRVINDMRKRPSTSTELKKRAKSLLREWQRLIPSHNDTDSPTPNVPSNGNGNASTSNHRIPADLTKMVANSPLTRPQSPALSDSSRHSGRKRPRDWQSKLPPAKRPVDDPIPNGSVGLHASASTPVFPTTPKVKKVKSTAELIESLQKKSSSSVGNPVLGKIAANEIVKEDAGDGSVLPESIRPRQNKKKIAPPESTPSQLNHIKTERVRNFVKQSAEQVAAPPARDTFPSYERQDTEQSGCPTDPYCDDKPEEIVVDDIVPSVDPEPEVHERHATPEPSPEPPKPSVDEQVRNLLLSLPPVGPLLHSESSYTLPETVSPTDDHVKRLHSEQWPSVSGFTDHKGSWCDWTQTSTLKLYKNKNSDEVLHVLPYVQLPLTDPTLPQFEWDKDIKDYLDD